MSILVLDEKIIDKAVKILEIHNTPKPYVLTLHMDFYDSLGKDYWINYKNVHEDVIIRFVDTNNNKLFMFKDGGLEEIND